ncbi:palmitoyltransferase ZDHHC16A isoform X1 [Engraulis encrasicolus]|uniref:palmitoyltransferase ZDHHC16A isoform X1 n=1 Tax=Engraulis encrasicolus TaxID=184585 RepID=UPI002FD35152
MRVCIGGGPVWRCVRVCCGRARWRVCVPACVRRLWAYAQLLARSLCFNTHTSCDTVNDTLFEPVFWLADRLTRLFGRVFVCMVIVLTSSIVLIAYLVLLPLVLRTYAPVWIVWHLCFGHWLIVMITFHYYKATCTPPGHPPQRKSELPFVSYCKKCVTPKPARTHHCGICNTCILKMDHHCPWLNNCVGHFNHRYFFSFCVVLTLGCVYCSISGRKLFIDAYNAMEHLKALEAEPAGVPVKGVGLLIGIVPPESSFQTPAPTFTLKDKLVNKSIIYMWVLTSTVAVALGGLTLWHAMLISRGETSIERHINKKERTRLAKRNRAYRNPFHYGWLNNWKHFLGVEKRSHWITRVLLPSGHPPFGDGFTWDVYPHRKHLVPV